MDDARRFQLLFGPYHIPRCYIGKQLKCKLRGKVEVTGISDARMQWPQTRRKGGGKPFLIVCGDLVRAVRREAAIAICHWWGVTPQTVSVWRKVLGVPQGNEGTRQLHRNWFPELRDDEAMERHQRSLKSSARAATIAAKLKGRKRPPEVGAKISKANRGRKHTAAARRNLSEAQRRRGACPPPAGRPFTAEEETLLGNMLDREVAARAGRDVQTVAQLRKKLGIPSFLEQHGYRACRERGHSK